MGKILHLIHVADKDRHLIALLDLDLLHAEHGCHRVHVDPHLVAVTHDFIGVFQLDAVLFCLRARVLPLLRELGIGLVAFSPLGRGFLTGTALRADQYPMGDLRRDNPRYQPGNYETNMRAAATPAGSGSTAASPTSARG